MLPPKWDRLGRMTDYVGHGSSVAAALSDRRGADPGSRGEGRACRFAGRVVSNEGWFRVGMLQVTTDHPSVTVSVGGGLALLLGGDQSWPEQPQVPLLGW
jgi:hypothetical protein